MMEMKTIDKKVLQRLAYIKFVFQTGLTNVVKNYPYNSIAILNFHDAVEFFMYLVAEVTDSKQSDSIMQYYDNIYKNGKGFKLKGKNKIKKLVKIRNNLKHDSFIPTKEHIEEATEAIKNFFQQNVPCIFGKKLDEINMIDLIHADEIRDHLKSAGDSMKEKDFTNTRVELGLAFWKLIDRTEEPYKKYGDSPFNFGSDMTFESSFFLGIDSSTKLARFIDKVGTSISKMKDAVRITSLGLDYRKFIQFTALTPIPRKTLAGTYHTDIGAQLADAKLTHDEYEFCINFIVEEYFVLTSN